MMAVQGTATDLQNFIKQKMKLGFCDDAKHLKLLGATSKLHDM